MYTLHIRIDHLPSLANVKIRQHWTKRKKENDLFYEHVYFGARSNLPRQPLNKFILQAHRFSTHEPDYDGLVLSFKAIIDGLVRSGVIADDKYSNYYVPPDFRWHKCIKKNQRIEIIVADPRP